MKTFVIGGIQKLTLLDFPGKVACTLFTVGCNFRCPFCHNASLVLAPNEAEYYSTEEILGYLKTRQGILEGVCISGGEPTLMPGLEDFIRSVKKLGFAVKLDTNGSRPEILKHLVDEGLIDYVAMDIKNSREKYTLTCGLDDGYDISNIEESAAFLMSGAIDFEFRTTVVDPLHEADDFVRIGEWLAGNEKYFLQKFVSSSDIIGRGMDAFSDEEMREFLSTLKSFVPNAQLRGI
ncbi:MAG: anaerobic ribonucleoside-triphosphate reductase activating protein [Ruminococcaceae bacterium]|nr:anaerobic ribonucleoside-triphosphate reductase activating protein [Oscillospiraceae bacterium]